ncbi:MULTISPECIES: ZIP family metal transporter [unclassified Sphingomonas]|uniref:ZIP family metal transporter n=1 Tax=unclassified Sphingomonas TaxID=196159 RepID=UPI00226A9C91|nr:MULTISPECIES: ZIP family metal transporter [unclassified Sphingomonas]
MHPAAQATTILPGTAVAIPLLFGLAASAATALGGLLALRLADRIAPLLAATAGIVLGVAFFDLLPEALSFGAGMYSARTLLTGAALGFSAYLLLARLLAGAKRTAHWQAHLGPASLTLHSLLDGLGMGLAFQIAPEVGWVVALAVLTHDVADGVNSVSLALAASQQKTALRWLIANALAPLAGVALGLAVQLPGWVLAPLLACFAGVFLYIGACELVPRSLARDSRLRTTLCVVAGVMVMLVVTHLAH